MKAISISNLDAFKILDTDTGAISYGCDQEWFSTEWQRRAGCGPSVASNILLYLNRSGGVTPLSRRSCAALMEEVWTYVTPTERGMPATGMFCEDVCAYGAAKGLEIECLSFDVPEDLSPRPPMGEISSFLERSLSMDIPVAFLNLCNGMEENLQRWHWVTVVSLEQEEPDSHTFVRIIDEGTLKAIDLSLWRDTTTCGGGFVYFSARNPAKN
ncbi:MAG: hypothetical protein LBQ56_01745 [Synergistaceae bacterium]|jgi:hypothetical protein|nr:hypothetical protein [Synergistaceae bacterium]